MNPDTLTAQALLNCLIREVSAPEEQVREASGHLLVRLARSDRLLRVMTGRPSAGPSPRLTGEAALRSGSSWQPAGWADLAALIAEELTLATGEANDEFAAQVRGSHAALSAIMRARSGRRTVSGDTAAVLADTVLAGTGLAGTGLAGTGLTGTVLAGTGSAATGSADTGLADRRLRGYLRSEQALIAGHRFHPAPKARGGDPRDWLPFAPETGASFPLRFLAVRASALDADGDAASLDRLGGPAAPPGYEILPAHPWQLRMLGRRAWLRRALRDGTLVDLGTGYREVAATSSVRTVYDPAADVFCKFSLNVRITNCVRKNSWYELAGAVALTRLLRPVFADVAARFPGTALLGEPGYRTLSAGAGDAAECLSVIVREGLRGFLAPGVTPVLAAALAEPRDSGAGQEATGGLLEGRDPEWLLAWWEAYVGAVAPPVLLALFGHGVVLEPHLQNVLVGVDGDGMPVQAIFRDLEGVKLVSPRHDALLATLKPGVARALAYGAERGWNRVSYCLLVNHLAEIAAAVADRHPGPQDAFEASLWNRAHAILTGFARDQGWPPQLRAALAGVPLPAKANLRLRWARGADREAAYLNVRNPMPGGAASASHGMAPAC